MILVIIGSILLVMGLFFFRRTEPEIMKKVGTFDLFKSIILLTYCLGQAFSFIGGPVCILIGIIELF